MTALGNSPQRRVVVPLERAKSFALGVQFLMEKDKPIDTTGAVVRLTAVAPRRHGGAQVLNVVADHIDDALGVVQFALQADDLDLDEGAYNFDITFVSALGYSTPVVKGELDLRANTDTDSGNEYAGINPSTNLAVYMDGGGLIKVHVHHVDGVGLIALDALADMQELVTHVDQVADQIDLISGLDGGDDLISFLVAQPGSQSKSAVEAVTDEVLDTQFSGRLDTGLDAELPGRVDTILDGDIPGRLTALDADAGSAFRAQQDARHQAAYMRVFEAPLSPARYGFVGDNVADDTAALQATFDAVPATGGEVMLTHTQNAKLLGKVTINKPVTVRGRGEHQRLVCHGDGIDIAAGVNDVHLADFGLLAAVRWTTTPHTFYGLKTLGTDASRNNRLRLDNLRFDGFERAMELQYVWASELSRITSAECLRQLEVYGLSVNNSIHGCNLSAARVAGGSGLRFRGQKSASDATAETAEGWRIIDNLIFGAETNIDLRGVRYFDIIGNIIDWSQKHGIWFRGNGTHYAGAHRIIGNYIAVGGSGGVAGIYNDNTIAKNDLDVVKGNLFNAYAATDPVTGLACACVAGVWTNGSESAMIVEGNTFRGFSTNDIRLLASGSIVRGNSCKSVVANQINPNTGTLNLVVDNEGTVFKAATGQPTTYRVNAMGKREYVWHQAPTADARQVGERVYRDVPAVGQPKSWVCTVAGSPGTWVSEGNL